MPHPVVKHLAALYASRSRLNPVSPSCFPPLLVFFVFCGYSRPYWIASSPSFHSVKPASSKYVALFFCIGLNGQHGSITTLGTYFKPVWKCVVGVLGGKKVSLDDIEHKLVREFPTSDVIPLGTLMSQRLVLCSGAYYHDNLEWVCGAPPACPVMSRLPSTRKVPTKERFI
jgi:hypothetical protein